MTVKMATIEKLECGSFRVKIRDKEPKNHEGHGYLWYPEQFKTRDEAEIYMYQQGIRSNDQIIVEKIV